MERLLTIRQVCDRTSLGRVTIYKRIAEGTFPRQYQISQNRVAWLESEIEAWIQKEVKKAREARP